MQNNDSNIIKTVSVVQYQIRVFDDLNLAFMIPLRLLMNLIDHLMISPIKPTRNQNENKNTSWLEGS